MSFLSDESSAESQPREGIEATLPSGLVYRLSTGTRDELFGGNVFMAYPVQREEIGVATTTSDQQLVIAMPLAHALPQRYLQLCIPPSEIGVRLWRKQPSGEEVTFRGSVDSMAIEGQVAKFTCSAAATRMIGQQLPVLKVSRSCPHILYDANCKVPRDSSTRVISTVTSVDGRVIKVASIGGKPNDWATWGDVFHVASGEPMTIESQLSVTITMQLPIVGLKIGDTVHVYAGCAHTISVCHTKFGNRANFGGFPQMVVEGLFRKTFSGIKAAL